MFEQAQTDPFPYIFACYALATLLLGGFVIYLIVERKRLRSYLHILTHGEHRHE